MELLQKYFSDFSEKQTEQFAALKDLYADWNSKINVISRKDMDNFYEHHVLHSLAISLRDITFIFEFQSAYRSLSAANCSTCFSEKSVKYFCINSIRNKIKTNTIFAFIFFMSSPLGDRGGYFHPFFGLLNTAKANIR